MTRSTVSELALATPTSGRIAALTWGQAPFPRVLAVHGWLDNAATFLRLVDHLPSWHCVAIDLPGHGRSEHRPPSTRYHFVDYIPALLEAADALEWETFSILGHSLGAGVGVTTAAVFPERIESLMLIDGIGPVSSESDDAPLRLRRSIERYAMIRGRTTTVYPDLETAVKARVQAGDLHIESARLLVERNIREVEGGWSWRSDPRLLLPSALYLTEDTVLEFLGVVEAPTLLIRATNGVLAKRPRTAARQAAIKNLTTRDVEGGHHVHLDDPAPVASALTEFMKGQAK